LQLDYTHWVVINSQFNYNWNVYPMLFGFQSKNPNYIKGWTKIVGKTQ
jgi:hypothetical protein